MNRNKVQTQNKEAEISNGMDKKKTILLVAPYFPPHSGGLERYVEEVASGLASTKEWKVVVLTTSETNVDCVETKGDVEIHRLSYALKISNTPLSLVWFFKIRSILKNVSPDIVNVHTPVPGLGDITSLLTSKETPLVVTYHSGSMKKGEFLKDVLILLYERVCMPVMLRKAKRIICSSDYVRNDFLKKYQNKSTTVTPATNADLFVPNNERVKTYSTLIFVAGLGSSETYKGLETLLLAMQTLVKDVPQLKLIVVGDGDMLGEYEEMAEKFGLKNHIEFKGKLQKEDVVRQYQSADILVLPTSFDSSPTVVIEAMSCGLPVISTHVGGIPIIVKEGETGILVEPNNVEQLQRALLELLENPNKQIEFGKSGLERVNQKYTWKERIVTYEKELLTVVKSKQDMKNNIANKKPTVVQIAAYYPPHVGGIEIITQEIAQELSNRSYEVVVLTSDLGAKSELHTERKGNLTVRRLRSVEIAHTPILWALPWHLFRIPKHSVIHIHLAQALVPEITLLIAKLRKIKIIGHFQLDVEPSGKLGWLFLLYKKYIFGRVLRSLDGIFVAANDLKKMISERYSVPSENIHIIRNAVQEKFFQKRIVTKPHTPFRILAVGRLTVQKRMDRMIRAMKEINVPAELVIIGDDGEDKEKLTALVEELNLKNVTFVRGEHKEIIAHQAWADVFVIPSEKEGGMPLVVLEAMAAGLPVVGSDLLGVRDVIQGVGVLVNPPEPKEFARALEEIYNSKEGIQKLSESSIAHASKYTWENSTSEIERVYSNVLKNNGK